jgi:hypothetical protein
MTIEVVGQHLTKRRFTRANIAFDSDETIWEHAINFYNDEVAVSKEKITKYYLVVIQMDVRISQISRIHTDFGDKNPYESVKSVKSVHLFVSQPNNIGSEN